MAAVEPGDSTSPSDEEQIQALVACGSIPADVHRAEVWYRDTLKSKLGEIQDGDFVKTVLSRLDAWSGEYSKNFPLLRDAPLGEIVFVIKPFKSVLNKLYRMNVLAEKPKLIAIGDCLPCMEDLVRTTVVCRFGDGPEFLANKLNELAVELGLTGEIKKRADQFGYYAIHFTFDTPIELLAFETRAIVAIDLTAEIQLKTQLHVSLGELTHRLYEVRRLSKPLGDAWKWDFDNPFFRSSFTGHTLHLLESILVDMKRLEDGKLQERTDAGAPPDPEKT
jgi:hypothetical protein